MLRCERIETALRDRVWTLKPRSDLRRWNGLLLLNGEATIDDDDSHSILEPSTVFLSPADGNLSLRVRAGSDGLLFSFDDRSASSAAGHGAEGEKLLQLLERRVQGQLHQGHVAQQDVEFALGLVMRSESSDAPGRETVSEAALKIVLVAVLQNLPASTLMGGQADRSSTLLQRFRQLMETHFRERWSVARYATELGIGPDRLHDLCSSKLERTPSVLIAERTIFEAKLLLRNSSATIEQISHRLGFKDPSHFSHFFSRMQQESPRTFRRRIAKASRIEGAATIDFADWP